jgi:hypothetical protein
LEASASIEIARHTLLSCGLILAIGTVTGLLAQKIRIPDVLLFLVAGIAIGPQALGLIDIKADSALNQIARRANDRVGDLYRHSDDVLIQAPTTRWLAKRLGLLRAANDRPF